MSGGIVNRLYESLKKFVGLFPATFPPTYAPPRWEKLETNMSEELSEWELHVEIELLRAELAAERERNRAPSEYEMVVKAERDAALARIAKLRGALEPFAAYAEEIYHLEDHDGIYTKVGDLRHARAVLEETKGDADE